MGKQVEELIRLLQVSLAETLEVLAHLSDAELDDVSEHPCAMGGAVRDLLNHNIDHERMHTGQVFSLRYSLRQMQSGQTDRLMAETLRARAELVASLIGLPDQALEARTPDDRWTIRDMIEHTLYWERHSIDDLARTKLAGRIPGGLPPSAIDVQDPLMGRLPHEEDAPTPEPARPSGNGDGP